jgi:hypothetical protein
MVMTRFLLCALCFLFPPPLPILLFAPPRRLVAVGMVHVDLLLPLARAALSRPQLSRGSSAKSVGVCAGIAICWTALWIFHLGNRHPSYLWYALPFHGRRRRKTSSKSEVGNKVERRLLTLHLFGVVVVRRCGFLPVQFVCCCLGCLWRLPFL